MNYEDSFLTKNGDTHEGRPLPHASSTSNNGQDPEVQLRELREYVARRVMGAGGLLGYVDVGISGTKEKRPQLDLLLADAHRRTLRCRRWLAASIASPARFRIYFERSRDLSGSLGIDLLRHL